MTGRHFSLLVVSALGLAPAADAAVKTVLDNDRMHVTESTFAPGYKTREHSHPADEATFVITGGTMRYTLADGSVHTAELETGELRWRSQAETHTAENVGDTEIRLLAITIKADAGRPERPSHDAH